MDRIVPSEGTDASSILAGSTNGACAMQAPDLPAKALARLCVERGQASAGACGEVRRE